MQTNLPGNASQRGWLRIARGGVTLTVLLGVLAFAVSFMDLSAFSATLAADSDSPGLGLFDNATPANVDKVSSDAAQAPVIVLNDWVYTSAKRATGQHQTKQHETKHPQTKPTKPTKRTKTKSPIHKTDHKTVHKTRD